MPKNFFPEGRLLNSPENEAHFLSLPSLKKAMENETILEATATVCTASHDLVVSLGSFLATIPREEVALGIDDGSTKEIAILTKVGRPISFVITAIEEDVSPPNITLSRKKAQTMALNYLKNLPIGSIIPATVTHMESFGAFVDLGCGFSSMLGIEHSSVSRISHPDKRFSLGDEIFVLITGKSETRIFLSHKELLGTWDENVAGFQRGMAVSGYVRGVKDYGAFVELAPNLTGLADFTGELQENEKVTVYIKSILPQSMKIKLTLLHKLEGDFPPEPLRYFKTSGTLDDWHYPSLASGK